eukprot:scaffold317343_cov31-Prasinocladus_malaysianus.AAC.4
MLGGVAQVSVERRVVVPELVHLLQQGQTLLVELLHLAFPLRKDKLVGGHAARPVVARHEDGCAGIHCGALVQLLQLGLLPSQAVLGDVELALQLGGLLGIVVQFLLKLGGRG